MRATARGWWALAMWRLGVVMVMLAAVSVGVAPFARATATGFTISPAFQQVSVRADQPQTQYVLQLKNGLDTGQNFRLSTIDFGVLDEQGGVAFLGQPASELEHRYGLASWMILEKDTVFVPAGASTQIVVTIDNRSSLGPGGHYGAVLATAVTSTGQAVADPRVGIKQVLSSLVLATKEGGIETNLKLVSQSHNGGWRLPTMVEQRFQNAGNVHVVPRGVSEIKDPVGRLVARGALNESSGPILPESFRRYKTPLMHMTTAWLPGRYTVVTRYRYDGTEQTKTLTTGFWYVGTLVAWFVIALVVGVIGASIWGWRRGWRPHWPRWLRPNRPPRWLRWLRRGKRWAGGRKR